MEYTTEDLKALIDSMIIDRIPAPDIAEVIETRANGNGELLRQYLHQRRDAVPDEYLTDAGNGEAVSAMWKHMTRYCYEYKAWMVYKDGRWMLDTAGVMRHLAVKTMRRLYIDTADVSDPDEKKRKAKWYAGSESDKRITAMLNLAASQPGMTIQAEQLDCKPWLLNVKNGTINLETCDLQPHNPEDLLTQQIQLNYETNASSDEWHNFIYTIFNGDTELIDFIKRAIGYSLNGTQLERVFFFLYGQGYNGKSQFTSALRHVLGPYAHEAKPEIFMERKYSSDGPNEGQAALKGVRFLTATEIKRGQNLDVSLVKRMTGGETIWHERKFQRGYEFSPTHTLWLSGNHEPRIKDTTDSIWDRLHKVPFENRIPVENEIKGYGEKLAATHGPAILTWCIDGAKAWNERGLSGKPDCVKAATDDYRARQDVLHDFIQFKIIRSPGETILTKDLYEAYKQFCESEDTEYIGKKAFNEAMRERGFKDRRVSDNKPAWVGITFNTFSTEKQESFLNARAREETFLKNGNKSIESNELPNCPQCGRNEWTFSPDGQYKVCPCGYKESLI